MYTVHATKKLLDRIKVPVEVSCDNPTTNLGNWYAKPLFWKPQFALFVNEKTYLPVLLPLAPAATLLRRFPEALAATLEAHGISRLFIDTEISEMKSVGLSKTQSRQLVGVLNEMAFHADVYRTNTQVSDGLAIALELSQVPIGIMRKSYRFPDQALTALVEAVGRGDLVGEPSTESTEGTKATIHEPFPRHDEQ